MDFSIAIQEFGFDCKIRKLSAKTIDNYRKQLLYILFNQRSRAFRMLLLSIILILMAVFITACSSSSSSSGYSSSRNSYDNALLNEARRGYESAFGN